MSRFGLRTRPNSQVPILAGGGLSINYLPSRLSDLRLWLDASDAGTITNVAGAISKWTSKDPNAREFDQVTESLQPMTGVDTINGLNVVTFAGDQLGCNSAASLWNFLHDGTKHHAWFVGIIDSTGQKHMFGTNNASGSNRGMFFLVNSSDALYHYVSSATTAITAQNITSSSFITRGSTVLIEIASDPSNGTAAERSAIRKDGGIPIKNNTNTAAVTSVDAAFPLYFGNLGSATTNALTAKVGEFIIAANPAAEEIGGIRGYLSERWGVSA